MTDTKCPLHITSEEDASDFVKSRPTRDQVHKLTKHELLLVAHSLEIEYTSDNVFPLANLICEQLFGTNSFEDCEPEPDGDSSRLNQRNDQAALDHEYRMTELRMRMQIEREVKLKQLELGKTNVPSGNDCVSQGLDPLKIIPPFDEGAVSQFFERFERIVLGNGWPRKNWSTFAQTALRGKALKACDNLSFAESQDYDKLKVTVLRAYELRPEAYRQKYRNRRRYQQETYPDFNACLMGQFDAWVRSEKVADNYDRLRELILLEDFLNKVEPEVRTYLVDKNVKTSTQAADLAQDYFLIRKQDKIRKKETSQSTPEYKDLSPKRSTAPRANPANESHNPPQKHSAQTHTRNPTWRPFVCTHCGKLGHTVDRCWRKAGVVKPMHFVNSRHVPVVTLESSSRDDPVVGPCNVVSSAEAGGRVSDDDLLCPTASDGVVQAVSSNAVPGYTYAPYLSSGCVQAGGENYPFRILRDTGASISLWVKPPHASIPGEEFILIKGVTGALTVPLVECKVVCDLFQGVARLGVVESLPECGVDLILGNDLVRGESLTVPVLSAEPLTDVEENVDLGTFPFCAVTRSMSRAEENRREEAEGSVQRVDSSVEPADEPTVAGTKDVIDLGNTFVRSSLDDVPVVALETVDPHKLKQLQTEDAEIEKLKLIAVDSFDKEKGVCFYIKDGVLWRRWRPPCVNVDNGVWDYHQIVVPKGCRKELLHLAHSIPLAGHMGVRKTLDRLRAEFFWPRMAADVAHFVRTCHTCQMVGSPNQVIKKAPLIPIPVLETPFTKLVIDVVGPLPPSSSGHLYLLTIMDTSTRYPEAIPLRNIKAKTIVRALLDFFTKFGLPLEVQTDQGSNFLSNVFQQALAELGVVHIASSAYHPESQGVLERYHQTMKNMLRKYCLEHTKD